MTRLGPQQLARRQHGAYTSEALRLLNNYKCANEGFSLLERDVEALAARFHVGHSIITFNAERLRTVSQTLLACHESFRRRILRQPDVALKEPTLLSARMAILLEFYLQIDGLYLRLS